MKRGISFRLAIAAFAALATSGVAGLSAAQTAPYPPSPVIAGITWNYPGRVELAPGSDLWPVTWGADGSLYTSWGDGGGFGGTNDDGRVSLGVARIDGSPPAFSGHNTFGGKNPDAPATFDGKAGGILSVGGALYMWVQQQDIWTRARIGKSTDGGKTWTFNSSTGWDFDEPDGSFAEITFLNFGKDYAGARDGYVYGYSHDDELVAWKQDLFMYRTPSNQMMNRAAFEFFAGFDGQGNPTWSTDIGQRRSVFHDPNTVGWGMRVMYHPTLNRYLLTTIHDEAGSWGIFDAPEPWGPWTTVAYYSQWIDSQYKFGFAFNQKWMSADGLTMDMVFSGTGSYDSFNTIRGTLAIRSDSDTIAPSSPTLLRATLAP